MALHQPVETLDGNAAEYWAIWSVHWPKYGNSEVVLAAWKDAAARQANKRVVEFCQFNDIDCTDKTRAEIYAIVKTKSRQTQNGILVDFTTATDC